MGIHQWAYTILVFWIEAIPMRYMILRSFEAYFEEDSRDTEGKKSEEA